MGVKFNSKVKIQKSKIIAALFSLFDFDLLNTALNAQVSDTTDDDNSTEADDISCLKFPFCI
jgi:hypothetical protein